MNIWKRFLSLVVTASLLLGMIVYIPAAKVEAAAVTPAETLSWDFTTMEELPSDLTVNAAYSLSEGSLLWSCYTGTAHRGGASVLANVSGSESWTDYIVTTEVTANYNATAGNFSYPALLLYGGIQVRVQHHKTNANAYYVGVYQGAWLMNSALYTVNGGSEKAEDVADGQVSYKVAAKIVQGQITVYINDVEVCTYTYTGANTCGTAGFGSYHTSNAGCAGDNGPDTISYKSLTIEPVVTYAVTENVDGLSVDKANAEAGETVTITVDETLLDASTLAVKTASGVDVTVTDGKFTMPAEAVTITCDELTLDPVETLTTYEPTSDVTSWTYSETAWADGIVEVDLQFPTITADELTAMRAACSKDTTNSQNPNYAVTIKTGSYSVTGTLFLYRNMNYADLRFDATAGLCATTNQRYWSDNVDQLFVNGSLATFKIVKVGNFIQVQLLDGQTVMADFSYTVPDGTVFTEATAWTVSVTANAGKVYTSYNADTGFDLDTLLDTKATIERAVVKRINKTVAVEVEGTNVTLPVTHSVVDETTVLARNAYYVGETVALATTAGYDYYANDEKIEDTDNFVIPDAETVTITAVEQERELHSATYTGGTFDADLWNTSTTLATDANGVNNTVAGGVSNKTPFNNGYIEADLTLSGAISNSALMYVHSPNNTNKNGGEDEILIRWNVAADTSKDGYTHYAQASFIIRDTDANGYDLDNEHGANIILATSAKIYFNTSTTMKVRMQAVGNLITVTVDGTVLFETTLNPDYAVTTNAGYFGLAFAGSVTQETARFSNVVVQELKTYSVQNDAAAGVELETIEDLAMKRLVSAGREGAVATNRTRTHYAPGEIVTLKVDESVANVSTLKVNGGAVEVTGSNGTYTFTMPAEAVTVTCDKLVTYAITEAVDGLSVDKTEAPAGATVTITLDETTLDAATLKVNDGAVTIDGADGVYTFTMPAGDVTITCEAKQLAANEPLYTNDGTGALLMNDGWSDDVTSDGTAITGSANYVYYASGADITDGWIKVTVKLPDMTDGQITTLAGASSGAPSNMWYTLAVTDGTNTVQAAIYYHRVYKEHVIRLRGTAGVHNGVNHESEFRAKTHGGVSLIGKTLNLQLRKVGNILEFRIDSTDGTFSKTLTYALDATGDLGSNGASLKFGIYHTIPTVDTSLYGRWTDIEIGRMNKTVTVTADSTVTLPTANLFGTTTPEARTAYQIGETIALTVSDNADLATLKANGTVIEDHAAFVIPNAETVTITCDAAALEPFYTNDFSANYDGLTLGSINLDSVECGRFTHTDGQLVITKDAGVDKNAQILATMASHEAVLANGFVTSLDITAYKQKTAEGADTTYPWILFTVNNKIQFRVIPAPTEDAPNRYGFVINNGESAGWVNAEGTGTSGVVWHYIELPGTMNTGTDGGVTYNVAVKLVGNAYTMYINGQQVFAGTTTADLSTNKVTFGGATSGGNTRGFTLKFDNLRIDRIVAPENMTFGQKVLALNADMALDFYISTSTTATTATLTLGTNDLGTVTLADAKRAAAIYDVNGDGIAEWSTWYVVTANVPVKDIAKDVTVTLDDDSTYSYSVEDYADYIVKTAGYSESVKKVAQTLLDYGTVAATYFADRSGSATLDAELSSRLDAAAIANTWAPTKTGTNEYISLYGCSLEAVEDANICMYFQLVGDHDWAEDGSNVSVTVNGEAVTNFTVTDAANGYKRVKITGIHAADLDVVYTVTVTSEHGDLTVSYSGLSYAYTAANYSAGSVNLKTLAKALYNYWDAAQNMN